MKHALRRRRAAAPSSRPYGLGSTVDSDQAESVDSTRCKSDVGVGL